MDRPDTLEVLIADDSEDLRQRVRRLLAGLDGVEIRGEATDAEEAITLAAHHPFDVAILDIQMPGSGIRALKHLRRDHPSLRIVMLTNHADAFYYRICMRAGADFFLDKSMEFDRLPHVFQRIKTGNALAV
ncbi:MAG: response regulator transcription factor [Rhodothermales bacterium]